MCSTWPLLNKYAVYKKKKKKIAVGLQTPQLLQTPCIAYGKGTKLKSLSYFCSGQNVF